MTRRALTGAGIAAVVISIYALRLDGAAGLIVDDAWYVVLAKALADGDGYRLISSATAPILPVVPPGFPALLSLAFLAEPRFPENLLWLKLVSVLAMIAIGILCWIDLTRHRGLSRAHAALLASTIVLTPAFVFLATSTVMAECVFTLAQIVAVLLVERAARRDQTDGQAAMLAGAAAAAVTLIRTAGIVVTVAAIPYLLLARRWRQALILSITVAVCLLPWELYQRVHAPTDDERAAHGGTIAYSYQRLLTMERLNDPRSGTLGLVDMSGRMAANVAGVFTRDVGAVFMPVAYRGPSESGEEVVSIGGPRGGSMGVARATMMISLALSSIVLAGWLRTPRERLGMPALVIGASLAMIAPVGAQTFRYVVPLAPYLIYFFWQGLRSGVVARVAVMCLLGFHLADHTLYIRERTTGTPDWLVDARENDELFTWMSTTLTDPGAVAATNPGLVYLRTGRKTVASVSPNLNWPRWKAAGIRYVVSTRGGSLPSRALGFRLLFRTSQRGLWVVEMCSAVKPCN